MSVLRPNRRKDRNVDQEGKSFLLFVSREPCWICSRVLRQRQASRTEAAHLDGTTGAKGSNFSAIPLCAVEHHQHGKFSEHALQNRFFVHWGLDKEAVLKDLRDRFEREKES